jgi:hypothetical protein
MDGLKEYLQTMYGRCLQAETEGKCECLVKHKNINVCPNWTKTTATSWEDMMALAKEKYEKGK